jgi:hypothetical protein
MHSSSLEYRLGGGAIRFREESGEASYEVDEGLVSQEVGPHARDDRRIFARF